MKNKNEKFITGTLTVAFILFTITSGALVFASPFIFMNLIFR